MEPDFDPLLELAVWGNLDRKTDLELILLKGHLILEKIIEIVLKRKGTKRSINSSFHGKIRTLEKIDFQEMEKKRFIIQSLGTLNRMRNKLAHEFNYDVDNDTFEKWSEDILKNLKGTKFTRYTFRTRKIHSFSIIAKNLLELK